MKNRLFWFLIIVIFIFVWFFWLINREQIEKNITKNTNTWILEEKEISFTKILEENLENNSNEKIENLKNKSSNFAYFNINSEKFYFNIVWDKLEVKNWENILGFFDVVFKKDIKVSEIFWAFENFLIEIWPKKYIFSKQNWFIKEFETNLKITYTKFSLWNFIFFSEKKWSFVLFKEKNELEYFSLFNDFVFYKDWYIWIISSNDSNKKNRFGLNWNKNFVLYFDPKTKQQKNIYDLWFFPEKIYEIDWKIFLENEKKEKFKIENF